MHPCFGGEADRLDPQHGGGEGAEVVRHQDVTRGHFILLEVPYSEHSSYSELKI